tara:strand:+ start:53 stop:235 length:183 start_codon:yes stop_codon:yes gene_type:complete
MKNMIQLELTPKEMRTLYVLGVSAMSKQLEKHKYKIMMNYEKRQLEHKLWLAFKQTETNN